jgi:hypothetical protein
VVDTPSDNKLVDWERRHKLGREAVFSALKPVQFIRVANLQLAQEIWQCLADEYGCISHLKLTQLNIKLRSLRQSLATSMQSHVDEFEHI